MHNPHALCSTKAVASNRSRKRTDQQEEADRQKEGRVEFITEFTLDDGGIPVPTTLEQPAPAPARAAVSAVRSALSAASAKDTPLKKETPAERLKRLSREMLEKKSMLSRFWTCIVY